MNWKGFGRKWPWSDRVAFLILEGLRKITKDYNRDGMSPAEIKPSTVLERYRYAMLFGKEGCRNHTR
jgi:hypothetical protein